MKRPSEERKRLPPELEAFARSDEEKLRIRRPRADRGRVHDPREGFTIAGVANRDARAVYDARAAAMQALWQGGAAGEAALDELGELLLDVLRLELWRARRVMGFEAFAEEVVGVPAARAQALAEAATLRTRESRAALSERAVAAWLRTEAGLHEGDPAARVRIRSTLSGSVLELSVKLEQASPALAGAGVRHAPLAREQEPGRATAAESRGAERPAGETPSGGARLLTRKRREPNEAPGFEHGEAERGPAHERRGFRQGGQAAREGGGRGSREGGGRGFREGRGQGASDGRGFREGSGRTQGEGGERRGFNEREGRSARGGAGQARFAKRSAGGKQGGFAKQGFGGKQGGFAKRGFGEKRPLDKTQGGRPARGDKPRSDDGDDE